MGNAFKDKSSRWKIAINKKKSVKPDYAEAYSNLGTTLDQGNLQEAILAYNGAFFSSPILHIKLKHQR